MRGRVLQARLPLDSNSISISTSINTMLSQSAADILRAGAVQQRQGQQQQQDELA